MHDDDKMSVWRAFLNKRACCVPPGFARKLHARALAAGVVAERWPLEPYWQNFFYWFAHLLTLQCADVEWRHARNRARSNKYGQTGMHVFLGKHIRGEAAPSEYKVHLRSRCQFSACFVVFLGCVGFGSGNSDCVLVSSQGSLQLHDPVRRRGWEQANVLHQAWTMEADIFASAIGQGVGATVVDPEVGANDNAASDPSTWYRAPTAIELFRHERLRRNLLLGRQCNPASEEFHADCRRDFEALTEREQATPIAKRKFKSYQAINRTSQKQATYTERAELLKTVARGNRRQRPARQAQDNAAFRQPQPQPQRECVEAALPIARPLNAAFCEATIVQPDRPHDIPFDAADRHIVRNNGEGDIRSGAPVSASVLEAICNQSHGVREPVESFKRLACFIAKPFDDDVRFPDRVAYPRSCGDCCMHDPSLRFFKA